VRQPRRPRSRPSPARIASILSWADSSNNEAGFELEREKARATRISSASRRCRATSPVYFRHRGGPPAWTYSYRVRAINNAGPSAYSSVAQAATGSTNLSTFTKVDLVIGRAVTGAAQRSADGRGEREALRVSGGYLNSTTLVPESAVRRVRPRWPTSGRRSRRCWWDSPIPARAPTGAMSTSPAAYSGAGRWAETRRSRATDVLRYDTATNSWTHLVGPPTRARRARGRARAAGGRRAAFSSSVGPTLARQDRSEHWTFEPGPRHRLARLRRRLPTVRNHLGAVVVERQDLRRRRAAAPRTPRKSRRAAVQIVGPPPTPGAWTSVRAADAGRASAHRRRHLRHETAESSSSAARRRTSTA